MIRIDGEIFRVPVTGIDRSADFLEKSAERTEDGVIHIDPIGVFFNYAITFGTTTDVQEYARLWRKLTEGTRIHTVTVPDEAGDYTFRAYFSGVSDSLHKAKSQKNHWKDLKVNFKAERPAGR